MLGRILGGSSCKEEGKEAEVGGRRRQTCDVAAMRTSADHARKSEDGRVFRTFQSGPRGNAFVPSHSPVIGSELPKGCNIALGKMDFLQLGRISEGR